jgi:hypothetical protein
MDEEKILLGLIGLVFFVPEDLLLFLYKSMYLQRLSMANLTTSSLDGMLTASKQWSRQILEFEEKPIRSRCGVAMAQKPRVRPDSRCSSSLTFALCSTLYLGNDESCGR